MLLGRLKYKCGPDLMCNKLEKKKKKKFRKGVSMLLKSLNKYTLVTEEGFFNKRKFLPARPDGLRQTGYPGTTSRIPIITIWWK